MINQILLTIPLNEFEAIQKSWIKDVLTEINTTATPPPPQQRETYGTRKQVSKELHISLPTLNDLSKNGVIKSYKIQGRVLYKWEDVLLAVKEVRTLKYKR